MSETLYIRIVEQQEDGNNRYGNLFGWPERDSCS